ncbi:hypothetical protein LAU42_09145 [Macrococcus armenti]|uniref:hypothetical protein n=1 Tax=Macrococcus armenti TaxID=2875764 RepID=UPI001CCCDA35|nr:hypothetical protein [Macrococcus armenti]UBH21930.1 hypothetical protein LAU42_09145 [Macrococcus armenti]
MRDKDSNSFNKEYLALLNKLEISYDSAAYKELLISAMDKSSHNNTTLATLLEISEGTIRNILNPNTDLPPAARLAVYLMLSAQRNSSGNNTETDLMMTKLELIRYIIDYPSEDFNVSYDKNSEVISIVPV